MAKKKKITTTVTTTTITETLTNEKTHIICILDRSGSMSSIINASISGFNEFLGKQKALPDQASISVVLFDDQFQMLYDNVDIKNAELLTAEVWKPRGMTALYDSIGKSINIEKAKLAKLGKEAPAKVLVCIVTDGEENASEEYKGEAGRKAIKSLIKDCETNDNWNFIYLASGQDAFAVGKNFGMSYGNTITYTANAAGVQGMSMVLNNATSSYRSMNSNSGNFKKMSKSLITTDEPELNNSDPQNLKGNLTVSGTITTGGNTNATGVVDGTIFTNSNSTIIPDLKDKK